MPEACLRAETDPVLAAQPQAQVDVLARCMWEALVEWKLARGECLHAKVERRHVPELLLLRQQPLARKGPVEIVVAVQKRGAPRICHAADRGEPRGREIARHVLVPIDVEHAVVVGEEDLAVPGIEGAVDRNVPRASWTAVRREHHMLDLVC